MNSETLSLSFYLLSQLTTLGIGLGVGLFINQIREWTRRK